MDTALEGAEADALAAESKAIAQPWQRHQVVVGPRKISSATNGRLTQCEIWIYRRHASNDRAPSSLRQTKAPTAPAPVNPWPEVRDDDRWAIELMEERLENTQQSPAELRARAIELRAEAQQTDVTGVRDATLALAERYEQVAAARTAAR